MPLFSGKKLRVYISVLLGIGAFLFVLPFKAQAYHSTDTYNKLFNDTLSSQNWNDLFSDFVNTWLPVSLNGPVGIAMPAPSSGLAVNGIIAGSSIISSGNVGIGTTNPGALLEITPSSGYALLAGNYKIGNVGLPTAAADAATKGYVDSYVAAATSSIPGLWGGSLTGNIWNLNSGNVGIGNSSPSVGLEVGSNTLGQSVKIDSTLGPELAPPLEAANWTLGYDAGVGGWTAGSGVLSKTASTNTLNAAPSSPFSVVAGHRYKVVITVSAPSAYIKCNLGGVTVKWLQGVGTYTEYITAVNTSGISFNGVAASTISISYLSVKEATIGTGDLSMEGDLVLGRNIVNRFGTKIMQIAANPSSATTNDGVIFSGFGQFGGQLIIGGAITGATTGAFSGMISSTQTLTTTPASGLAMTATAATAAIPVRISPSVSWNGTAWNTTPTAASKQTIIESHLLPVSGATTSGSLVFANLMVDGVANSNEIMRLTTGGNVGIGATNPGAKLEVAPSSGYAILAGNYKIGNVALPTVDADAATKGYVDSMISAATSSIPASSFSFVGLTPTAYTGNNNGTNGYTTALNACASAYSGSHVCEPDDMLNTIAIGGAMPGEDAWIFAGPPAYTASANDCEGRSTAATTSYGAYWQIASAGRPNGRGLLMACNNSLKLACCK